MSRESQIEDRNAALKRAFDDYYRRNTLCRAPGCTFGFVAPDPTDIDPYTEEPRTEHCPACKGSGFVPRQQELPL